MNSSNKFHSPVIVERTARKLLTKDNNILAGAPITKLEYARMGDLPLDSLKVVNSLCESLTIKVYRGGKCYQQDYVRGVAQHEISCRESACEHGTENIMKPDTAIFEDIFSWKKKYRIGYKRIR